MAQKVNINSSLYKQRKLDVLELYAPPVHQCQKCGNPVISRYCCGYCGDNDPGSKPDTIKMKKDKNDT